MLPTELQSLLRLCGTCFLVPDKGSEDYHDDIIEIDLTKLEGNGSYTPDMSHHLSNLLQEVEKNGWPKNLSASLIGSWTNSPYEDLMKVRESLNRLYRQAFHSKRPSISRAAANRLAILLRRIEYLTRYERPGP